MARLLAELASRQFDRIIIRLAAAYRHRGSRPRNPDGQIVLIVWAENTLQSEVRQALAAIESRPVKLIVLNQVFRGKVPTALATAMATAAAMGLRMLFRIPLRNP